MNVSTILSLIQCSPFKYKDSFSLKMVHNEICHVNFELNIRARIMHSGCYNPFRSSLLCSVFSLCPEESLRFKLHTGWLVGFSALQQTKKASSSDAFCERPSTGQRRKVASWTESSS